MMFLLEISQKLKPNEKNNKKYFPGAIGKKNLVPTAVPTDRKLQVTLRHFSEAPANICELLKQQQRAIKVYLLDKLR